MPEKLNSGLLENPNGEGLTEVSEANSRPHCGKSDGYPIIFVKDSLAAKLHSHFEVREFYDLEGVEGRHCYIFHDPQTPEVVIRKIAWRLGGDVQIYRSQQLLECLCSDGVMVEKELAIQIIDYAFSYKDWAERCDAEQLTISEAEEIARAIYKNEKFTVTERQAEIAKLSGRIEAKVSYQWSKLMWSLEVEFQRELIARGIVSDADLRKELTALTEENDPFTRKIKINQLATAHNYSEKQITGLLAELEKQLQLAEDAEDNRKEINSLLDLNNESLDLNDFLPSKLAQPLKQYCQWLSIKDEVILLALLTATSSLHEAGTKITLQKRQNFSVPPTIFGGVVAESGQKKSPITRQIITYPLAKLEAEAQAKYLEEKKQYEAEVKEWQSEKAEAKKNNQPFDEPKPVEPKPPTSFWFTNATGEGIKTEAQNYPNKILFGLIDELAGLFNSQNAYRGGKGSDRQELLSFYDGYSFNDLRSGQNRKGKGHLSLFGTIQPDVLKNTMKDCRDPDGQWSRFLFVQQPLVASELPDEEEGGIDITNLIAGIYRRITLVPVTEYRLSRKAFKLYQPWYNKLEQMRVNDPVPGLRAVYSKAEGYTGRLALNLHVLHELTLGVTPSPEIPVERMREAIKLMQFFLGQTKRFYSQFDDGIASHLTKIVELSNRKGWVKAKDVQLSYQTKERPKPDIVRQWFIQAEQLGFGQTRGTGKKLEFISSTQKVDKVDKSRQKVDNLSTTESIDITSFDKKVDKVDEKLDALSTIHTSKGENQFTVVSENPVIQKVDITPLSKSTLSTNQPNQDIEGVTAVDSSSTDNLLLSTNHSNQDIEGVTEVDSESTDNLLLSTESTDKVSSGDEPPTPMKEEVTIPDNQPQPETKNQVNPTNGVDSSTVPTYSEREETIFQVENYSNKTENKRDWDGAKYDSAWDDGSAFPPLNNR